MSKKPPMPEPEAHQNSVSKIRAVSGKIAVIQRYLQETVQILKELLPPPPTPDLEDMEIEEMGPEMKILSFKPGAIESPADFHRIIQQLMGGATENPLNGKVVDPDETFRLLVSLSNLLAARDHEFTHIQESLDRFAKVEELMYAHRIGKASHGDLSELLDLLTGQKKADPLEHIRVTDEELKKRLFGDNN